MPAPRGPRSSGGRSGMAKLAWWVKFQQGCEAGRRDTVRGLLALEEMVGAYQMLQQARTVFLLAGPQVPDRPVQGSEPRAATRITLAPVRAGSPWAELEAFVDGNGHVEALIHDNPAAGAALGTAEQIRKDASDLRIRQAQVTHRGFVMSQYVGKALVGAKKSEAGQSSRPHPRLDLIGIPRRRCHRETRSGCVLIPGFGGMISPTLFVAAGTAITLRRRSRSSGDLMVPSTTYAGWRNSCAEFQPFSK